MRISIILLIFLLLFNGWGALLQDYDIDDHLGINAETGDPEELQTAVNNSQDIQTGEAIGGTLLGYYNALLNTLKGIVVGLQPGVQMLVAVAPPGAAEDLIIWAFSILPIVIAADFIAIARGVDL